MRRRLSQEEGGRGVVDVVDSAGRWLCGSGDTASAREGVAMVGSCSEGRGCAAAETQLPRDVGGLCGIQM